jgi:hypothetical protein
MPKQPANPGLRDAMKKKVTRREQFLAEMDVVVPWARLQSLIEPHYPKVGPRLAGAGLAVFCHAVGQPLSAGGRAPTPAPPKPAA